MQTPHLPKLYCRLLELDLNRDAYDGRVWLGDVGFETPPEGLSMAEWQIWLERKRWPGMHADLIPFASDAQGNRYCFRWKPRQSQPQVHYWMYETYRSVPLSDNFECFMLWLSWATEYHVFREHHALIDLEHIEKQVIPAFEALGLEGREPSPSRWVRDGRLRMHQELIRAGSCCPSSYVALGVSPHTPKHLRLAYLEKVCAAERDFAGAHIALAHLHQRDGESEGQFDALWKTLGACIAFSGDPHMAFYEALPSVAPNAVSEALAKHPATYARSLFDPLWELVLRQNPLSPLSWLQVCVEYANAERMREAIVAAQNALALCQSDPEHRVATLELLGELYEAYGASAHAQRMEFDLSRHRRSAS